MRQSVAAWGVGSVQGTRERQRQWSGEREKTGERQRAGERPSGQGSGSGPGNGSRHGRLLNVVTFVLTRSVFKSMNKRVQVNSTIDTPLPTLPVFSQEMVALTRLILWYKNIF